MTKVIRIRNTKPELGDQWLPYTVEIEDAGGDTVSIGVGVKFGRRYGIHWLGVKFGLPHILANALFVLLHLFDEANDAGTTTVNAALEQCVYELTGVADHVKVLDLIYLV